MGLSNTGTSDHMIESQTVFSSYENCCVDMKIAVKDGLISKAASVGNIHLSNMTLQTVLHVPNIHPNFISVSKFTKDLNCAVAFSFSL